MAITAKPQKPSTPSIDVEALINKGGSVAAPDKEKSGEVELVSSNEAADNAPQSDESKAVLLRVPVDILQAADAQIKGKRPRVPRHTWILEAMLQRIERDSAGS